MKLNPSLEAAGFGVGEEYNSKESVPIFSHEVHLDFETRDTEGHFATPEGVLKHKVLSNISSEAVTAAVGQLHAAYGAVGMAGAGKTSAL